MEPYRSAVVEVMAQRVSIDEIPEGVLGWMWGAEYFTYVTETVRGKTRVDLGDWLVEWDGKRVVLGDAEFRALFEPPSNLT